MAWLKACFGMADATRRTPTLSALGDIPLLATRGGTVADAETTFSSMAPTGQPTIVILFRRFG